MDILPVYRSPAVQVLTGRRTIGVSGATEKKQMPMPPTTINARAIAHVNREETAFCEARIESRNT
jgi:hypothetical protein